MVLQAQLLTFRTEFLHFQSNLTSKPDIFDIKDYFHSLNGAQLAFLSQVSTVLQVILMPATNATSEWSFGALRRVKTYSRNTMSQQRMNNLMLLHVHKDIVDSLDLRSVANDFVADSELKLKIFGKFFLFVN